MSASRLATREYAINASNYRHWPDQIRSFIDDCVEGESGPHGKDFNMHWLACTVAEAHRIFSRGGVFLYPGDDRPGYQQGRLRLLYEAFPIAMLVEQAGGAATDGMDRILAKKLEKVHQRTLPDLRLGRKSRAHRQTIMPIPISTAPNPRCSANAACSTTED